MKIRNLNINNKLIFALSLLIILSLAILLALNLSPNSQDMHNINKICKEIKVCNSIFKDCLNDSGLDINKAENELNTVLPELNSIRDTLSSLKITNTESTTKDMLLETLNSNINLYESCLTLIKNPHDKEIVSKYNDYSNNYSTFLKSCESLTSLGLDSIISSYTKDFFRCSFDYFNAIIKINRDTDIHIEQKKSYVINIESCINSFNSMDEDLKPALEKIKQDNRNLNVLLKDIKDKKSKLNDIKNKSYNLSIPENGSECYKLLQNTISLYELYINSLEYSITTDKNSQESSNSEDIEKNYTTSFSKYNDFIQSFQNLRTELDNFNKR